MISFVARLFLFPLQLLAFAGILFLLTLWLQSETIDSGGVRGALRLGLAQATGQGVSVGKVDVKFNWPPQIVVHNLRIAGGSGGAPMLRVKRVEADLDPWHLMIGNRKVISARFVDPHILVERDRRGRMNWGGGENGLAKALARAAKVIGAKKIVISGGRIVVRDRRRGSTTVLNLNGVDVESGVSRASRE